jgi:hypothetical protein
MRDAGSTLKFGRSLAVVTCATLMPFGAAYAEKNILGLENPEFGQRTTIAYQQDSQTAMNCPEIKFLGNSIPNCTTRGAQGPVREDSMESSVWKEQRHESYLGGRGTP